MSLVSSADECAKEVYADADPARSRPTTLPGCRRYRFLTTGSPEAFEGIGPRLMGGLVAGVEQFA